jgi:hypothetical protein
MLARMGRAGADRDAQDGGGQARDAILAAELRGETRLQPDGSVVEPLA